MFFFLLSTVIQCEKMSEPTHGSMKCSDPLGSFSYQSTCTFTCDEGYVLSGSPSLQCEASANWNGSQPYCVGTATCFYLSSLCSFCYLEDDLHDD